MINDLVADLVRSSCECNAKPIELAACSRVATMVGETRHPTLLEPNAVDLGGHLSIV